MLLGPSGGVKSVKAATAVPDDAARLVGDEKLRRQMGAKARESALSRYRTDLVIPQYIKFYEEVLHRQLSATR